MRSQSKTAIRFTEFPEIQHGHSGACAAGEGRARLRSATAPVAALLLLITRISLAHAQSCTIYNAATGSNAGSPWESSAQAAANALVEFCNSGPQGWRACFAQNQGWCNALPGYTCIAQMPASIPTPKVGYPVAVPMSVLMTNPEGAEVTWQTSMGIGADSACNEYFVQAPVIAPPVADQGCNCQGPTPTNGPDPIDPAIGNEFLEESDIAPVGWLSRLGFKRYLRCEPPDARSHRGITT